MFSGIIQAVGTIEQVEPLEKGVRLTIEAGVLGLGKTKIGDSIAMNGACMTATSISGNRFTVDVSRESLDVTVGLGVRAPKDLGRYIARKGSITVNGVSLTVNRVEDGPAGATFEVNLIPHTLEVTTLSRLVAGAKVNLEIDLLARYVQRLLEAPK